MTFGVSMPSEDNFDTIDGAVSFVLDRADFHLQFAATRYYAYSWSDVSYTSTDIDTSFVARDENADGFADLVVREKTTQHDHDYENGEDDTTKRSKRSATCLYERAGDRWVCPVWLGTELVEGSARVELTRVPLPPLPSDAGDDGLGVTDSTQ